MSAYDDVNAASIDRARVAGWPELAGSDKQIGWANTLREKKIGEAAAALAAAEDMPDATKALFSGAMLRETRAGEWIDGRSMPWAAWAYLHLTDDERATLTTHQREGQR